MKNIYIAVAGTEARYTRLDVNFTADNYAYVDAAQSNYDVFKIFVTTEYDNTINKSSYGKVREFALLFPEETDESVNKVSRFIETRREAEILGNKGKLIKDKRKAGGYSEVL